jgi:hypothetical protein
MDYRRSYMGTKRPLFGVDTLAGLSAEKRRESPNPAVDDYGPGPEGATCGECVHLVALHYSRTYYKCEAWKLTHGAATDFRKKWPACERYYKLGSEDRRKHYDGV